MRPRAEDGAVLLVLWRAAPKDEARALDVVRQVVARHPRDDLDAHHAAAHDHQAQLLEPFEQRVELLARKAGARATRRLSNTRRFIRAFTPSARGHWTWATCAPRSSPTTTAC